MLASLQRPDMIWIKPLHPGSACGQAHQRQPPAKAAAMSFLASPLVSLRP
jgi:hypothetical protein